MGRRNAVAVRENVKFMNVERTEKAEDPGKGQRVRNVVASMVRSEQKRTFLGMIANEINRPEGDNSYQFEKDDSGDVFKLGGTRATAELRDEEMVILAPVTAEENRPVWMSQSHGSQQTLQAEMRGRSM